MKIICTYRNDVFTYGLASTFTVVFPDFKLWETKNRPIYDIFDTEKPDLFICHSEFVELYYETLLSEYADTKFIIINTNNNQLLRDKANIVIEPTNLANVVSYANGEYDEFLETDIIYISRVKDDELEHMITRLTLDYVVKAFGSISLGMPQYLGLLSTQQTAKTLFSAKICIDNGNSCLDAATNKTISICKPEIANAYSKFFLTYTDFDSLRSQIDLLLEHPRKRKKLSNDVYQEVITKYTYFHYLADIFVKIGLREESKHILSTLGNHL
jgi:hypothetical protein